MSCIYIDGEKYKVDASKNILHNCILLGKNIPYFCWHPILGSVGSCRQCAVKVYSNEKDNLGRIVMSCMLPSKENTIISIKDKDVVRFRRSVLELLMLNHPHDCPICSEGGNCHLQDMTVMTKHINRRYRFTKRTYTNQYLGPFIKHEMNRCIHCYRCVRYYKDYAQGTDFDVYGIANSLYFGRIKDGKLEDEHSGNLIEICPTGVFTDKTNINSYSRKWDLQYAPSVCHFCSIGCNIIAGEREGELQRIENRYNSQVNHHFICDKGRFGYGFTNVKNRPNRPKYFNSNLYITVSMKKAIRIAKNILLNSKRIIGIGSSRSSIENNYALLKLVGSSNFSSGMMDSEKNCIKLIVDVLESKKFHIPTLYEIENNYDAVIVIGEDLTITAPRISLSLKQCIRNVNKNIFVKKDIELWNTLAISNIVQNKKNSLFIFNTVSTKLASIATWNCNESIEKQIAIILTIIDRIKHEKRSGIISDTFLLEKIKNVANVLRNAKAPLIIAGAHARNLKLLQSAIVLSEEISKINKNLGIVLLPNDANSIGVSLMEGHSIEKCIDMFKTTKNSALILMEIDLYRVFSKKTADYIFHSSENIIVLDHLNTVSTHKGNLILPSTNFFESSGTVINYSGRAQRFFKVYDPNVYTRNICRFDSWKWLSLIRKKYFNIENIWKNIDDVINDCSNIIVKLRNIKKAAPNAAFRIFDQKIPRSPNRLSGRTVVRSQINIHEDKSLIDNDTMFSFSMEGSNKFNKYSTHIPFIWFPGWNSPQAWNRLQSEIDFKKSKDYSGIPLFDSKNNNFNFNFNFNFNLTNVLNTIIKKSTLQIITYHMFFGSEEMTQYSALIKKYIGETCGLINVNDANKLKVHNHTTVSFHCLDSIFYIKLKISNCFPEGFLGLPLGKVGMPLSLLGKDVEQLTEVK